MNAIEKLKASPLEHLGQRVITLGMMDEVHRRPAGTARRAFNSHKAKLENGRHFFRSGGSDVLRTTSGRGDDVLLTERGYLMLVKTFRDDLAWRVQEDLVEGYFRGRAAAVVGSEGVVAILAEQVTNLHGVICNFVQGALAAHGRRMDMIERGVDERVADLTRQVKQLRAGARVQATGRRGGSERKTKHRAARELAAGASQASLPGTSR